MDPGTTITGESAHSTQSNRPDTPVHVTVIDTAPERFQLGLNVSAGNETKVSHAFDSPGRLSRFFTKVADLSNKHHWYGAIAFLVALAIITQLYIHVYINRKSFLVRDIAHTISVVGTISIIVLEQCISYYTRNGKLQYSQLNILVFVMVCSVLGWILGRWSSHSLLIEGLGMLCFDLIDPALLLGLGHTSFVQKSHDAILSGANAYSHV